MKLKPFNPKKTPRATMVLVYFPDSGYHFAEYRTVSELGICPVWLLRDSNTLSKAENTFWCELPKAPEGGVCGE